MKYSVKFICRGVKVVFINMFITIISVSAVICSLATTQAEANSIYFNNFNDLQNNPVGNYWSASPGPVSIDTVPKPNGNYMGGFLGQFTGNDSATLSLGGLSTGWTTLSFDTYFIRSWDGADTEFGPDYFKVNVVDGPVLLNETFSNGNPAGQSYSGNGVKSPYYPNPDNTSMTGSLQQYSLGYYFYDGLHGNTTQAMDSVYHFDLSFFNASDSLQIQFAGVGLQDALVSVPDEYKITEDTGPYSYIDESWGIDNVRLDIAPVPEPSSLWLLSAGGIGLLAWRRRKQSK